MGLMCAQKTFFKNFASRVLEIFIIVPTMQTRCSRRYSMYMVAEDDGVIACEAQVHAFINTGNKLTVEGIRSFGILGIMAPNT